MHYAVGDRRYPQGSLFRAARFGDPYPFDWLGLVGASFQMLIHGEQPTLAVFPEASYRDAVHAADPCVGLHLFPSELKGSFCADLALSG